MRQIPVNQFETGFAFIEDEVQLVAFLCGKDKPWALTLAPESYEQVLATGQADLVSMARPLLADPAFVAKAAAGRADEINTCIACNQACLDHTFAQKISTCLVNPRAAFEQEIVLKPVNGASKRKRTSTNIKSGNAVSDVCDARMRSKICNHAFHYANKFIV